jgi:uncharacterized protein
MTTAIPFARPLYVMLKPAGSRCNMACTYCYYKEKGRLDGVTAQPQLGDDLLETFIQQYIEAQTMPQVLFTWHGGEPLLRPLSFYRRALELQHRYAHGRQIDNCLQTNGTLLTDEWCAFLRENNFLVGLSIDGPQPLHDEYRRTQGGQPTWQQTLRGIRLLQKHGVEWNAMAVVNARNATQGSTFYQFFKDLGCQYLQFTPVVERATQRADGLTLAPGMSAWADNAEAACSATTVWSVTPEQWGNFLCTVYDEWVREDVGRVFVQLFDATLANWAGEPPGICSLSPTCGHAAVMEWNGDVYACDHFVYPEYRLGNIREQPLTTLLYGERQQRFGQRKRDSLPRECRECRYLFACHGECPKNRFVRDHYGESGLNYLCAGYRTFFDHVATDMAFMKNELDHGRAPANIMAYKAL